MNMVRILMVGSRGSNNEVAVEALRRRGLQVEYVERVKVPDLRRLRKFDVVYGVYLQTCSRYLAAAELLGKRTIIHFVGSDAYRYAREKGLRKLYWRGIVRACDLILYVSPHLKGLVNRPGVVLPFPINVGLFERFRGERRPERDILYYCPSGGENARIYRLDWIRDYARRHPEEKITIIGSPAHPADYRFDLSNVEVIPYVPYEEMGEVYARHRRLIRMTSEDGKPRMVDEALLCGLEVIYNGEEVREIPPERHPEVFAEKFCEELSKILSRSPIG